MDFIFDNFEIFIVLGLALAAWVKNRTESKESEEDERRAREEMARHFEKLDKRPIQKNKPESWDTRPQQTPPIHRQADASPKPPPLADPPKRTKEPSVWDEPAKVPEGWGTMEAHDSTSGGDPHESPMMQRQREMQERLAEIKRETEQIKSKTAGARETQRRLERKGQTDKALVPMRSLRQALQDKRQVKRAVILREIIGKPLALR